MTCPTEQGASFGPGYCDDEASQKLVQPKTEFLASEDSLKTWQSTWRLVFRVKKPGSGVIAGGLLPSAGSGASSFEKERHLQLSSTLLGHGWRLFQTKWASPFFKKLDLDATLS